MSSLSCWHLYYLRKLIVATVKIIMIIIEWGMWRVVGKEAREGMSIGVGGESYVEVVVGNNWGSRQKWTGLMD